MKSHFEKHITKDMNVMDFGCGGGFLLNNLTCNEKIGIDINDDARKSIDSLEIQSFKYAKEAPDNWADLIISNHALEHVPDPLNQLLILKNKLKTGGKIVFVVPFDNFRYKPNDINYHLYTWSPMNLGNLFTEAGFNVLESKEFIHRWPPLYYKMAKMVGGKMFHSICRVYGFLKRHACSQVKLVAEKV
jgi:SAM-dependent methyltransferase